MTRMLPRTNFHSSTLARCLADLAIVDDVDSGNAFAEQLSLWIPFADAITLSAVHNDGVASLAKWENDMQPQARAATCAAAVAEFDRIQTFLTSAITKSCSSSAGKSQIKLPIPELELPMNLATAYAPYRRFYEAHQRDMEMSIAPLRVNVREVVAKASARLKKLADLDAAFEKILRDRERRLLAKVPVLLRKRFEQLFKQHQQKLAEQGDQGAIGQTDNPAGWTRAGGWLARFCNDLHMLLLAEVELRLQPTMGLIEALNAALKEDTKIRND